MYAIRSYYAIIHELLWFLQGDTNIRYLKENGVRIWDEWADENGDLGPVYGHQWRHWKTPDGREIDQITQLVEGLKKNPDSRRHIVTAWNPSDVDRMALPPCHALFQFYVANGKLSCRITSYNVCYTKLLRLRPWPLQPPPRKHPRPCRQLQRRWHKNLV